MRSPSPVATIAVLAMASSVTLNEGRAQKPPSFPDPAALFQVPLSPLIPGGEPASPALKSPTVGDAAAIQRGMQLFDSMNCIGCHAPNGGGGMGPALSTKLFIYGGEPANIFLSIHQGRPNGMPSWGAMLPDNVIWDLVAYIKSLSSEPDGGWGETISRLPPLPNIQQVPAELTTTDRPWSRTEPFGEGRKPQPAPSR